MIVSNTTPLSNFLHLERMDILQQFFEEIHIPFAVKKEIEECFQGNVQWRKSLDDRFICVHHISSSFMLNDSFQFLHQGEAEALSFCLERKAELCLLDDKDARTVAGLHGINITGTLGLLIKAKKEGLVSAVQPFMDTLREEHSFWISDKMYRHVLQLADEIEK